MPAGYTVIHRDFNLGCAPNLKLIVWDYFTKNCREIISKLIFELILKGFNM